MIVAAVREFPSRHPGLVDHEVLLAPPDSLLYVSRWRCRQDLVGYAGEHPGVTSPWSCRARTSTSSHHFSCGTSRSPL
ncbi:hypothetical protein [Streptomyces sp. NPDC060002]|uniref:hypothetical protein n=1 Tax=Streptomyces sp. NPDC060002 TaxID=3347033 RepID=UPI0036B1F95E